VPLALERLNQVLLSLASPLRVPLWTLYQIGPVDLLRRGLAGRVVGWRLALDDPARLERIIASAKTAVVSIVAGAVEAEVEVISVRGAKVTVSVVGRVEVHVAAAIRARIKILVNIHVVAEIALRGIATVVQARDTSRRAQWSEQVGDLVEFVRLVLLHPLQLVYLVLSERYVVQGRRRNGTADDW